MLPVIVTTAQRHPVFGPNDHGAVLEITLLQRSKDGVGERRSMPDIGHITGKQRPQSWLP